MIRTRRTRLVGASTWLLAPVLALPLAAQEGDPGGQSHLPRPDQTGDGIQEGVLEPVKLPASDFGWTRVEDWDVVYEREAQGWTRTAPGRAPHDEEPGEWFVPEGLDAAAAASGERAVVNSWGDRRMGIGFPGGVDLEGLHVGRTGSTASYARRVQLVAYAGGRELGRSDWFAVDAEPRWLAFERAGVERVEVLAENGRDEQAWYCLDDLTFTRAGERVVVDFEDLAPDTVLTGSGHAGLEWEVGRGFEGRSPVAVAVPPLVAPAPLPVLAPAAPAAPSVGVIDAPDVFQEFFAQQLGVQPGTGAIPSDTHMAVGTSHVVTVTNSNISVFNKANGAQISSASLAAFFGGGGSGDPRVVYDPIDDRFVVCSTDFNSTIFLAVSTGSSGSGPWFKTSINVSQGADSNNWPDFPSLGVDARGIYFTANMITPQGFASTTIWAVDKAPLIASPASLGTVSAWRSLPYQQAVAPAVHWDDPGRAYLINTAGNNQLEIRRINPPLTNPSLQAQSVAIVADHNSPPNAPASGSGTNINTGDDRIQCAVFRDGSLWAAHTVGTNANRAGCRWYELNPLNGNDLQRGTVRDDSGSGRYFYYPSLAVNSVGDVVMGFSGSASNDFVGAYVSGRRQGDTAGEMSDPFEYHDGTGAYQILDNFGRNRWGDYSGSGADPVDDTFWTAQSFARSGNSWRVRVGHSQYDTPLFNYYCVTSPNSAGPGATILANGSSSVSANDLLLSAFGMPANQFMLFFYGSGQTQTPVADGFICLSNQLFRLPAVQISGIGDSIWAVDLTSPPQLAGQILSGSTWNFQGWYRDPAFGGAGSNFTDAVEIQFVP